MTKSKLFHLKNDMLGANFLANFIGVFFVNELMVKVEFTQHTTHPVVDWFDKIYTICAFILVIVLTLLYERPIRQYMNAIYKQVSMQQDDIIKARRKLLNEPFFILALDLSVWMIAAVAYPTVHWIIGSDPYMIQSAMYIAVSNGLITATIVFFLLEHVLQKRLAPFIFPEGGLTSVPKTWRIKIRTRLIAALFACNLIPLFSILHIFKRISRSYQDSTMAIEKLESVIYTNSFIFACVGIGLIMLVSKNLTNPFKEILKTLRSIRNGYFDRKVQVTSNDEIGYTGDVINEMTEGLKERERLRQSLDLAKEVQQNLMPKADPRVAGLDIAGTSIYCEQTGGDYYDYLDMSDNGQGKIGVIVGDVSDHGIQSALLMTTVRAFLRQRAAMSGDLDLIIADVNRQLSRDVRESGRFMTLFFSEIDRQNNTIRWVRAGHDPAMIFDPITDNFEELSGNGLPLGVFENSVYVQLKREITPGQIMMIGTDGIWESQNTQGQMFGKARFKDIIRAHENKSAKEMLGAVISALDDFRRPLEKADDVTLVIVKVEK
jgi:sigma-B regulation protein RsbU (phosphoserine phosphatase)